MISTDRLSDLFVEMADTLIDDFDLVDFLAILCEHAALVGAADAVGLVLADQRGDLQFMAASNESGKTLELLQIQSSEGPCLDCFRHRQPVINTDLTHATELWPSFAPAAMAVGFRSVHAFPMRLRHEVIGALNLFNTTQISYHELDARIVQSLADVATIAILQERIIARAEALTEQLQGALNSRIVIEQARALSRIEGVDVDVAFDLMRLRARNSQSRLVDVAHEILRQP